MHMQPVFEGCRVRGGRVAEEIFEKGLCLPSGNGLDPRRISMRVIDVIKRTGKR